LHVRQQGKKLVTKSFIIQACPPSATSKDLIAKGPRVGFIVTKKNGNAVERNRIKRRFRALIRDHIKENHVFPLDYVIVSRPGCKDEPFQSLNQMLEWAFKKYQGLFKSDE
jgi:ribonuclease P protein component